MKNVLLLVHDDSGQEARLQAALDLTRLLGGHLNCVDVTPPPVMADSSWGAPGAILYDETDHELDNLAHIKVRLASEDVAWSCEAVRGDFVSCLGPAAHIADVAVLNCGPSRFPSPDMRTIIGELLASTPTLVLAVPEDCGMLNLGGPALVAWDGSKTVMRTIKQAAPLLALSESVIVFQAGTLSEGAISAYDAARYLARHGIGVVVETSENCTDPASQITQAAARYGTPYCVMGGFGHSQLKEAIFGGVTRKMLGTSGLALLLGH
jgi:nucleotide-binding universal stress UspA family protein